MSKQADDVFQDMYADDWAHLIDFNRLEIRVKLLQASLNAPYFEVKRFVYTQELVKHGIIQPGQYIHFAEEDEA